MGLQERGREGGRKRGSEGGREGGRAFACNMIASTNPCLLTYQIAVILVAEICTLTHPSFEKFRDFRHG